MEKLISQWFLSLTDSLHPVFPVAPILAAPEVEDAMSMGLVLQHLAQVHLVLGELIPPESGGVPGVLRPALCVI